MVKGDTLEIANQISDIPPKIMMENIYSLPFQRKSGNTSLCQSHVPHNLKFLGIEKI